MAYVEFRKVKKQYRMGEVTIDALRDITFETVSYTHLWNFCAACAAQSRRLSSWSRRATR